LKFISKNTPQLAVGMKAKEKPLNDFVKVKNSFDARILASFCLEANKLSKSFGC
jgi:hypothetical protein